MLDICFYNFFHIGDVYFSSFFINHICKLTPDINFLYYFINGDIFFENTPNIQRINNPIEDRYANHLINGYPPECLLNTDVLRFLKINNMEKEGYKVLKFNNKDILFINTWCWSTGLKIDDFNIPQAIHAFDKLIDKINKEFNLNINFKCNNCAESIKDICLSYKSNKKFNMDDKSLEDTIFVFNYNPRSVNYDMRLLNSYILHVSQTNKVILSTHDKVLENMENISFFDTHYNIYPTPNCENLIDIWEIASKCKHVILQPCGAGWIFFQKLNMLKPNQLYMFNENSYRDKLNDNINLLMGQNINLISSINVNYAP